MCLIMELATGGELMQRITEEESIYSENEMRKHFL